MEGEVSNASSVSRRISRRFYPYMWSVDETHVVLCTGFLLQILSGQHCLNCLLLVPLKWSINFTFRGCLTSPVSLTRVHFLHSAPSCGSKWSHIASTYVPGPAPVHTTSHFLFLSAVVLTDGCIGITCGAL